MVRKVLLGVVLLSALALIAPPLWFRVFPQPFPELPPPGRRVELPGGLGINVLEEGTGPAVVMSHGLPGSAYDWRDLSTALAARGRRALAYDRVGYGHSDARPDANDLVTRNARDLIALLEALELRDATVVGWSYGGAVAMVAAQLDASRIGRLVLVGSGGPDSDDARPPQPGLLLRAFYSRPALLWRRAVPPVTRALMQVQSAAAFSDQAQPEWWIPDLRANLARRETTLTYGREMFSIGGDLDPEAITVPVLILHGHDDRLAPVAAARYLHTRIPDARLNLIEGGSHMLPITHAEQLATEIAAFSSASDVQAGEMLDFDQRWDYAQPEATEAVFRALLPAARASGDPDYLAQLLTQLARTQSLQRKFEEAHAILDEVEGLLTDELEVARIRYLLERGRTFHSARQSDRARPLFQEAWERGQSSGADFYAVDAAHMLGIVESGDESLAWNRRALALAESSRSERARGWLGSLYNNVGWTHHEQGNYTQALVLFEKALAFREEKKHEPAIRIAKWSVARTLRSLGRVTEALAIQQQLYAELETIGEQDGYVDEELAECLLELGREAEAREHFARAHALLSRDAWLAAEEPARIARLQELGRTGAP